MTEHIKEPVYLVTPVYNRKAITLAYLENLKQCGDLQRYHVVIVDDGSIDGTSADITSLYPEVILLSGTGDLWWTGAMVAGMQEAHKRGAAYFFWINDDCLPQVGTLPMMTDYMRSHPDTLVSASFHTSESIAKSTGPVRVSGFRGRQGMSAAAGEVVTVDGMSGWCVGIPVTVFEKIGPPNAQKFPHYAGDSMYTLTATRAGFRACILGDAIATLVDPGDSRGDLLSVFKPELSPIASLRSLFWDKKSPFRFPTQFFYHTTRYGMGGGIPLFLGRALMWLGQWTQFQIASKLKVGKFSLKTNV